MSRLPEIVRGFIHILKHPIQRMPALLTGWYDEKIMKGLFYEWYQQFAARAAAEVGEGVILDIGTGAGYIPLFMARPNPRLRVTGIDLARHMIRRARRHARELGAGERVTFEKGEAGKLRFADAAFDMVMTTMTIHCLRRPPKMLDEIHRVLKPGGLLWLVDIRGGEREDSEEMFRRVKALSPWFMRPFITERSMKESGYSAAEIEAFFGGSAFKQWQYSEEGMFFCFSALKD